MYYFLWGLRHRGKAKTTTVHCSDESNKIETHSPFFFANTCVLVKGGLSVFAFLRQSEVILEMILQLNLYIIKQIPYLYLKIVYHLFYSINLELKLDGLEFNSQNI